MASWRSCRPAFAGRRHRDRAVEALIIPPDRLRALLIAEAELGERIMRALILRRVGLLQTGAGGPVIVGRAENGDVLRLQGFLRRNGHPHTAARSGNRCGGQSADRALPGRPRPVADRAVPGRRTVRKSERGQLARCIGLVGPIDPGARLRCRHRRRRTGGLAAAVYGGLGRALGCSCSTAVVRRAGRRIRAHWRLSRLSDGISGMALMRAPTKRRSRVEMAILGRGDQSGMRKANNAPFMLKLINNERAKARAVVIASGARYRQLAVDNLEQFEGASVHYWASPLGKLCAGQEFAAGRCRQSGRTGVVYLASQGREGLLIVRGRRYCGQHVALSGRPHRG